MNARMNLLVVGALLLMGCGESLAGNRDGFDLDVLVDDQARREYPSRGKVYVEAVRGASYELRVTNPLPVRVAVALSVDGLNTISGKHTKASNAPKWIIEPYDSIIISGWQVNDATARQFFFTGERNSYGAAVGQTQNLGVIEAQFFRERPRPVVYHEYEGPHAEEGIGMESRDAAAAPPAAKSQRGASAPSAAPPSDDYAATGMGNRRDHRIDRIDIDLEESPAASVRIRYEFRPQLVKLGIIPSTQRPLERREQARGFVEFCREPDAD